MLCADLVAVPKIRCVASRDFRCCSLILAESRNSEIRTTLATKGGANALVEGPIDLCWSRDMLGLRRAA